MSTSTLPELARTDLRGTLSRFFFAEEVPYGVALMRIFLPLAVLGNVLFRWVWARELYTLDGAPAPLGDNFGYPHMLPICPATLGIALYTLQVAALICASAGFQTRISLLIVTVLFPYFALLDCMSTLTKYNVIATHGFLLLALSPCGEVWSIDAWLKGRRAARPFGGRNPLPRHPVWAARLIQLALGIIYLGAAVTKMHTDVFFSGDQLMYWMMDNSNGGAYLGHLLSQFPIVLMAFAYITIVWEVAFLFAVWRPWMRELILATGVMFHVMTFFTLALVAFPLVMISMYLCFVTEHDVVRLSAAWRRLRRKVGGLARRHAATVRTPGYWLPQAAPAVPRFAPLAVYGLGLAVIAVLGVELEYRLDLYQVRGSDGPRSLKKLDPTLVATMLAPEQKVREKDKFLAVDTGKILVGNHLVDRRSQFRGGDRVVVQASLNPPHEDLWLECQFLDSDDRLIQKLGQIVIREHMRVHFTWDLSPMLEPGEYAFVVRSGGELISRRKITVLPGSGAVAAN